MCTANALLLRKSLDLLHLTLSVSLISSFVFISISGKRSMFKLARMLVDGETMLFKQKLQKQIQMLLEAKYFPQ